jgi:GxxExxY protein
MIEKRLEPDASLNRLTQAVIGAAIEVHRELGPGFLESVYEEALSYELSLREIGHVRQAPVHVTFKGQPVGEGRIDILVDDRLVVELKAVEQFDPIHVAQVISYLKASHLFLGLLINFNVRVLKDGIRRVVFNP